MRKLSILPFAFLFSAGLSIPYAQAQLSLEHTFPGNVEPVLLANSGLKFYSYTNSVLTIYNPDGQQFGRYTYTIPSNAYASGVSLISETFFDLDSEVEFLVTYYESLGGGNGTFTSLLIDNGTTFQSFPYASKGEAVRIGQTSKMLLSKAIYNGSAYSDSSDLYAVPGSLPAAIKRPGKSDIVVYPNPSTGRIRITDNTLQPLKGENIRITDTQGRTIQLVSPLEASSGISLEAIAPGSYLLQLDGGSYPFVKD